MGIKSAVENPKNPNALMHTQCKAGKWKIHRFERPRRG